ncbi:hypothetical protein [Solibacillus sp. CAU 1738]|uniref:hypothetical protein n=1 Tax=Solibacillus sp. CAU 1738 TaxID=3140363 RepID=UPI00326053C3
MSYFKFEVDGESKNTLTEREEKIIQNAILNLAAMTNALLIGKGVMLNPPDEGKLGITFAYPEAISAEQELEIQEALIKKLDTFFQMSELTLATTLKN